MRRSAHELRAPQGRTSAAVAVIVRDDGALLFIRRPLRASDRWSGDVAFPGGLAHDGEECVAAARRETHEEVGIDLGPPLGALSDRFTAHPRRARPIRVRPIVFGAPSGVRVVRDPREVAEAFWVPLARLRRLPVVPAARRIARVPVLVPSIDLDGRLLWGLTLSMVRELLRTTLATELARKT